jgi:hypothetical protein
MIAARKPQDDDERRAGATTAWIVTLTALTGALLLLSMASICRPPSALATPPPGSLEESCIAAGTVLPTGINGFMFNHHPEKKREARASDHYQTALETVAEFQGTVPRMPAPCEGHFTQVVLGKAEFQAARSPHRWRSLRRRWERLPLNVNVLEFVGDPPPLSSYATFGGQQGLNTFGLGCTLRGRVDLRLEVVDEADQAIIAIRDMRLPLPVDSWFRARCLGRLSIQESSGARHCGQAAAAKAGRGPTVWGVKIVRMGCAQAMAVARRAFEAPSFLRDTVDEVKVGSWSCYFSHRGAAGCTRGRSRLFLVDLRGHTGEQCAKGLAAVRSVTQAGTSCAVAQELIRASAAAPRTSTALTLAAGGASFTCGVESSLGMGDRMEYAYACAAGGAVVSFRILEPKSARMIPVAPTTIPSEVKLPPAGLLGFPRTPKLKFGYAVIHGNQVWLPLEVDPALVGREGILEITIGTMSCEWTADPSDTDPTCGTLHRQGPVRRRTVVLQANQEILIGPDRHNGNWDYAVWMKTKAFVSDGLPYTHAAGWGYAILINHATNCAANPWCHPDQKRVGT